MNWLITGGCGFIGTNLIKRLQAEDDHHIRVLDNLSVGTRDDLQEVTEYQEIADSEPMPEEPGVYLVAGDILDAELAMQTAAGCNVIVHLAASTGVAPSVEDPRSDCITNVIGTLNMLEAARHNGVKRFVFASSGAPIGEAEPPLHEELAPHPVSPYGASKLAGEGYCSAYYRTFGVETVALRFGNVYGEGSGHKNSVVAKFIKQALAGEKLEIYGDGGQTRDFIHISDLIDAVSRATAVENIGGECFQVATAKETTVREMVDVLFDTLTAEGIVQPETFMGPQRDGDVIRNFSDTSKARDRLGWQAKVALRDGLGRTVRHFLSGEINDATVSTQDGSR